VVQGMLEMANIPYTGSKVLASALSMNKLAAKRIFNAVGVPTPRYIEVNALSDIGQEADKIRQVFPGVFVLKPVSEGSSLGVKLIKQHDGFAGILAGAVEKYKDVFVEEYIKGTEITIGVIGRWQDLRALPILELIPKNEFYDFEAKYTEGLTEFVLPARLPEKVYQQAQEIALAAHKALGCYGVSRVDMLVGHDHIPYVTEINSIPGMTDRSDLPAQAKYAGISFDELVAAILESAF
jgi:D-alanine-D-alanine ligase